MEQIITKEDREIYHQMLDKYLDEPESVRKVGPRMMQFDKAEIDWDNECASPGLIEPKGNIKRTTYQMTIYINKK
jgi:hypothetical protein